MFNKEMRRRQRRHRQLMEVTSSLIDAVMRFSPLTSVRYEEVTPVHVVSAAFGRYQLRVEEPEATEHLRAALVLRGYSFGHLPSIPAAAVEKAEN
jgi:hypothetical protein